MPCCFKKNPLISANKIKQNYNRKCIENDQNKNIIIEKNLKDKYILDKLYIINDINKIHEDKYFSLPKPINILLNEYINNDIIIKNHYFEKTNTGYYLCYCVK